MIGLFHFLASWQRKEYKFSCSLIIAISFLMQLFVLRAAALTRSKVSVILVAVLKSYKKLYWRRKASIGGTDDAEIAG